MHILRSAFVLICIAPLLGCGDPSSSGSGAGAGASRLDGRTYTLKIPAGYDGSRPLPLIVSIHGYSGSGLAQEQYFGLDRVADERGFFVVYPDGTVDQSGRRFFSATDACCDFFGTGVDDVAFIDALVDHLESVYAIDATRVYSVGHSNGGFMSHRLACDQSRRFAAIVSLSGATWKDSSRCQPVSPVAILEVHGSDDVVISPAGGDGVDGYSNRVYPSLDETMGSSAHFEHCPGTTLLGPGPGVIDSATSAPTTSRLWSGCQADVSLWIIQGGTHVPLLTPAWADAIVDFLLMHSKATEDTTSAQ